MLRGAVFPHLLGHRRVGLALSWWISGIPFDLLHGAGNFAMALALFKPCRAVLYRLYYGKPEKRAA